MSERCEKSHCRTCSGERGRAAGNAAAVAADAAQEAVDRKERRAEEFSSPVCIQTDQIYDACRDRDCVTDQRVYFTASAQEVIEQAINVKVKNAEIIWVKSDVEPVPFNRGYYSVDMKFFICVTFDVYTGVSCPTEVKGLTTFDKRVILFGSEGNTKSFESTLNDGCDISEIWQKNNLPKAVVVTVDPIVLSAKLVEDTCCCCCDCGCSCSAVEAAIPSSVSSCFDDDLVISDDVRQVKVSFGLFTIVKLERSVQLLVDAIDFCIPTKECPSATESDPCELFDGIRFPVDEFFPPIQANNFANSNGESCSCGCSCCD